MITLLLHFLIILSFGGLLKKITPILKNVYIYKICAVTRRVHPHRAQPKKSLEIKNNNKKKKKHLVKIIKKLICWLLNI